MPQLDVASFHRSLEAAAPPPESSCALAALWWARRADWERAHVLVQDEAGADAAWVHAHLHRVEGDIGNAAYWYRRAGRQAATSALDEEWRTIVATLLAA